MRYSLIIVPFLFGLTANAVTVNISFLLQPVCTYSNGKIRANASGGVGPYRYLWSTGDTTQIANNLVAGPYSVTVTDFNDEEASASYDLTSTTYALFELSIFGQHARCDSVDRLVLDAFNIPGPSPYYINGVEMSESGGAYWYDYIPQVNDTQFVYSFADGNGCTGTVRDNVGWPIEYPEVEILEIHGSCSNDSSGYVTIQTGSEGHGQPVLAFLRQLGGDNFPGVQGPNQTETRWDLPPGDYVFEQVLEVAGEPFLFNSCPDLTFFTIPDLGPGCGTVRGISYMDADQVCALTDFQLGLPNVLYEILPGPYYTYSQQYGGHYAIELPTGTYTIEQVSNTLDPWCTPGPIPFGIVGGTGPVHVDIADTSLVLPTAADIQVMITSGAARPGFELEYAIDVRNLDDGYTGSHVLTMDFDPVLSYISATQTPASDTGNTLTWNLQNMSGFQTSSRRVRFQVPPDIALLGTVLHAMVTVAPGLPDINPANNTADLPVTISGAYDPNDKLAKTSTRASDSLYYVGADDWIDYTIRFQNTGTDTAFNIVITDTIAANLDLRKFTPGPSSHPCELSIRNGTTLRFAFYRIQLPDSNVNESASHGYVSFRIAPKEPLLPAEEIANTANIFFDYNPPVITERSVLTAEFGTGIQAESPIQNLWLMPNPTNGSLEVRVSDHTASGLLQVVSVDGRVVLQQRMEGPRTVLDVAQLSRGLYTLNWHAVNGTVTTQRFVRE